MAATKDFEQTSQMSHGCNSAFITLIPRVGDAQLISDYRRISLVSMQYIVLSKLLASRLWTIRPVIISDNQSAFPKGRQILDCIVVANEIVEWAKRSKSKLFLLKVDFAKAFDYVNWSFLDSAMCQMGFRERWR